MSDLKKLYNEKLATELKKELSLHSVMAVPTLSKITLNMCVSDSINDRKALDKAIEEMHLLSGQKPVVTRVRKSIAGFKIREGYPIGCKVTLRKEMMWNFLEKIIHVCLPRVRDFRGMSNKSFDKFGNYSFGIKEQIIFPEIDFDKIEKIRGLDVILSIKRSNKANSYEMLKKLGFPFKASK
jgi:large subunit ribosomal protein L5